MLDFRMLTFLAVCEHLSFTKAAQHLNLTQPAVSQHIQTLQQRYGKQLFVMEGRQLKLTDEGKRLYDFARSLQVDIHRFTKDFLEEAQQETVQFGATLTIGEFTLPSILYNLMQDRPYRRLSMHVDNTENLLAMIDSGTIDFAFIEGAFDKQRYGYRLFSHQRFIAIGSHACLERHPNPSMQQLLKERLLVREKGSGTRAVLEQILAQRGLKVESFLHADVVGNLNVIKTLVEQDVGISFMYEAAAKDVLESHGVEELSIQGWQVVREFNFVYSHHTRYENQFLAFLTECLSYAKSEFLLS